jgi:3-dehydroquinate dehydratase-1
MSTSASVKTHCPAPQLVAVISSLSDLRQALRMQQPPDLFELRLDALAAAIGETERALPRLRAPIIATARHPAEGGLNALTARERRALLLRFLDRADYIDIEVRSVGAMREVLSAARAKKKRVIISHHDLKSTPVEKILREKARAAAVAGADIFKIATRTDTPEALARLFSFFAKITRGQLPIAAMGMGGLGANSRVLFAQCGSALNYAFLGEAAVAGQWSLADFRRALEKIRALSN